MLHPTHAILNSQNGAGLNRRTINFGLVALLHVALVWAIASAIVPMVLPTNPGPIDARVIDTPKQEEPVIVKKSILAQPKTETYVEPIFVIESESSGGGGITVQPKQPPVVSNVPDTGPLAANARTIPPYPALAARMGQQGKVMLKLSISENGLVTGAEIVKSSGFAVLDQAAIAWVKDHWKYKPAIQGGQPVASATQASLTFNLQDAR